MSIQFKPKQHNEPSFKDTEYRYDLDANCDSVGQLGDEQYCKETYRKLDKELAEQGEP
jgi:hypothetical protein